MRKARAEQRTRERVIDALINAHRKLRPAAAALRLVTPCSDLWDEHLELIELLMEISAALGLGRELNWQKAPPRTATVDDFIDWIVKEMNHG